MWCNLSIACYVKNSKIISKPDNYLKTIKAVECCVIMKYSRAAFSHDHFENFFCKQVENVF